MAILSWLFPDTLDWFTLCTYSEGFERIEGKPRGYTYLRYVKVT